ncbi:uncharacterized protein AB675_8223 [Cyphellophora attinorum]|uniref:Thiamine-triphosphatase n=1 Tax=Cyphellophora attinorum TaxID=1664694 RepID=A0A0N1HAS8_9EURO|nr:uncharacterized protein AB675_8223 [Phialophora attinorum]KPI41024.1 hypothetical protein AB675_8223 [Phialophora attinorum]
MAGSFTRTCILEVERKFRPLNARELVFNNVYESRKPSIRYHGVKTLSDAYYDRSKLLSSAGIWVRERNERWQAKVKHGGSFNHSKFEDLTEPRDIAERVGKVLGEEVSADDKFGLGCIAQFTTIRHTYLANDEFKIVLDTTHFFHSVGEVELQKKFKFTATTEQDLALQKQNAMEDMDQRIAKFMDRYSWTFSQGEAKGKLTAWFEKEARQAKISADYIRQHSSNA